MKGRTATLALVLAFTLTASAKDKLEAADFPLTVHVISSDCTANGRTLEVTLDGQHYLMSGLGYTSLRDCMTAGRTASPKAVITVGQDYPARRNQWHGQDTVQMWIRDRNGKPRTMDFAITGKRE